MKKGLVSVLMPAYNVEKYIETAIRSILEQTYPNFELLILDDCSSDSTGRIVEKLCKEDDRICFFKNNINLGIAFNRNFLIEKSEGQFIAFLDADDVAVKNRLELQTRFLNKNQEFVGVGGKRILIDETGKQLNQRNNEILTNSDYIAISLLYKNCFTQSTMMFNFEICKNYFKYDLKFPPAEDYELWSRLSLVNKNKLTNLNEYLVFYRIHSSNSGNQNQKKQLQLCDLIIKRNFESCIGIKLTDYENYLIHHHLNPELFNIENNLNYIRDTLKVYIKIFPLLHRKFSFNTISFFYYQSIKIRTIAVFRYYFKSR